MINKRWLLMGEGEMLQTNDAQETNKSSQSDIVIPAALVQMFSDMAATIRSQQEMLREQSSQASEGKNAG